MKEFLNDTAGIISLINLIWYAWNVWCKIARPSSTASWLMWVVLDAIILGSTIATHKPFMLPLSYTIGSTFVLLVHFKRGAWVWTWIETWSLVGAVIATILWQTLSPVLGVIAGTAAITFASIPIMWHMWRYPDRKAFWVFFYTTLACALTLVGTWP